MHIKDLPYIIPGGIIRDTLRGGIGSPLGVITIIHPLKNLSSKKYKNVTFSY